MKKNRRLSRIVIFSGILLLIQACSFLNPSESDAKAALNELCQKRGGYCQETDDHFSKQQRGRSARLDG
jgi:hypothetical protein